MSLDESHPLNRQVIRYFTQHTTVSPPVVLPKDHPDPYRGLGSHPDIVERIWDQLGAALPTEARVIVYGTPVLVHPESGVLLAVAHGTQYAIRVPEDLIDTALEAGCASTNTWSDGSTTDIEREFGRGWLFGSYDDREGQWLATMSRLAREDH